MYGRLGRHMERFLQFSRNLPDEETSGSAAWDSWWCPQIKSMDTHKSAKCRASQRNHLSGCGLKNQGHNLALTVLYVPYLLEVRSMQASTPGCARHSRRAKLTLAPPSRVVPYVTLASPFQLRALALGLPSREVLYVTFRHVALGRKPS